MASPSRELDILLVGKTGNGKSATGNSITGRKSFESKNAMESVTKRAQIEYSEYKGRKLKVVDTPGLLDTVLDEEVADQMVLQAVREAMEASPKGYHAILIVEKFGDRFGKENVETVAKLKDIFGHGFIEEHSILVFTCGDMFETDEEVIEDDLTFDDWMKEQAKVPTFTELAEACGNRYVLFNNRAKDEKKEEQLDHLIQMIDNFTVDGRRYTNEQFKQVEKARQELYDDPERPFLKEEFVQKTALITQQLGRLTDSISKSKYEYVLGELHKMKEETNGLYQAVEMHDNRKGFLKVAMTTISKLKANIDMEIEMLGHLKVNSEQEAALKEQLEKKRLESEATERRKKEEQDRRNRELILKENNRKLKEAESRKQIEKWRSIIEEEKKRIKDENEHAEEEEQKKEESHRLFLEKQRQILEKERKKFEDEKARVEQQARRVAEEAKEIRHMKEKEDEKRREELRRKERKELLRIKMEELRQEEERIQREEDERRAKEKKEREEFEARKREQEEAERKRREKEEEEIRRKEEELKRIKEEEKKAVETVKKANMDSEQGYQQMKEGYSRGVIGTVADGLSWAAGSTWSLLFGKSG